MHPLAVQLIALDEQLKTHGHSVAGLIVNMAKNAYGVDLTLPEPATDEVE